MLCDMLRMVARPPPCRILHGLPAAFAPATRQVPEFPGSGMQQADHRRDKVPPKWAHERCLAFISSNLTKRVTEGRKAD
eukprot:1137660-Pelagomonas_calceolata.AAC.3